eukprot:scaffold25606_cov78-Phaeocystis_antarctica.AAC.1
MGASYTRPTNATLTLAQSTSPGPGPNPNPNHNPNPNQVIWRACARAHGRAAPSCAHTDGALPSYHPLASTAPSLGPAPRTL